MSPAKKLIVSAVAISFGALVILVVMQRYHPDVSQPVSPRAGETAAVPEPPKEIEPPPVEKPFVVPAGGSPLARSLNAPTNTAAQDVAILSAIVRQFLTVEKPQWRKPVGDNFDMAKALMGSNRTHTVFIPAGHPVYDDKGRLADRWGTPYFVHPLASDRIEIRSAGPDRKLFTADDVK